MGEAVVTCSSQPSQLRYYESRSLLRCCGCCLQCGVLARRTLYSSKKSCRASANQILHWQQCHRCRSCRCCPRSGRPVLRQPDLQPLHQGGQQEQQQGDQQQDLWWPDSSKRCLGISGWFCWSCFGQQCSRKSLWAINNMWCLINMQYDGYK